MEDKIILWVMRVLIVTITARALFIWGKDLFRWKRRQRWPW